MLDLLHISAQTVNLTSQNGQILSPRGFLQLHLDSLSEHELQVVHQTLPVLPDHTHGYPFEHPMAVTSQSCTLEVSAQSVGQRSVLLPEQGLYIKGCRPINIVPSWCDSVKTHQEQRLVSGAMGDDNILRELLGYLIFRQQGWPLARFPVAVLQYQHQQIDCYALVFSLAPDYCTIEQLFVGQNLPVQGRPRTSIGSKRMHCDLPDYLAKKAQLLAATHAQGVFRGYNHVSAANDLYSSSRKVATLVEFDSLQLKEMSPTLTLKKRIILLRCAFIEAAKSLLPSQKVVWVDGLSQVTRFAVIEQTVLQNGWMQQYTDYLTELLVKNGWHKSDVTLGWLEARKHPVYQAAIAAAVTSSDTLYRNDSLYC